MTPLEAIGVAAILAAIYLVFKLKQEREMPKDTTRRAFSNDEKIKISWNHYEKHGPHCAHCSSDNDLDFDHIKPLAKGGLNVINNMQVLCGRCNSSKGARFEG